MQLTKATNNGKLRYFCQGKANIAIIENAHYRWICFNDVIQSLMLKRKPEYLTLPHQTAILLPLLFFKPTQVAELGLGGGNITRFLTHVCKGIHLTSIEYDDMVIRCFEQFFNPNNADTNIRHQDANLWLKQQNPNYDWLICDVYQQQVAEFHETLSRFNLFINALSPDGVLTINLPDASDEEVNLCLTVLQQLKPHYQIVYFHIPNYLNIVIHLVPETWKINSLLPKNKQSYLSVVRYRRWRKFWQEKHTI